MLSWIRQGAVAVKVVAQNDEENEASEKISAELSAEFASVAADFKKLAHASRDPLAVAAMLDRLTEERKSTNLVLKEISRKLEEMDSRIHDLEKQVSQVSSRVSHGLQSAAPEAPSAPQPPLLPDIDESILGFVRKRGGRATADEVQRRFHYKGANAASARLNGLFKLGFLEKRQVGRKVFFIAK